VQNSQAQGNPQSCLSFEGMQQAQKLRNGMQVIAVSDQQSEATTNVPPAFAKAS